jgi:hypothetical protein
MTFSNVIVTKQFNISIFYDRDETLVANLEKLA